MSWHTKRLLRKLSTVSLPAEVVEVAQRRISDIVSYHVLTLNFREPLDDQMKTLALSCYSQGLCDGASPEIAERLKETKG